MFTSFGVEYRLKTKYELLLLNKKRNKLKFLTDEISDIYFIEFWNAIQVSLSRCTHCWTLQARKMPVSVQQHQVQKINSE